MTDKFPHAGMFRCSLIQGGSVQPLLLQLAYKEQIVITHLRGEFKHREMFSDEQARGKARPRAWYLQSPGLLFLDVGGEDCCVLRCFCDIEDGATLGNTVVQEMRGVENA